LIIYKKDDIAFLDVSAGTLDTYNNPFQDESNIKVRIGDLDSLNGYSGTGAVFNENITIKNGPFKLNSDGSGNIGTNLN
jgi:hypothetical protein